MELAEPLPTAHSPHCIVHICIWFTFPRFDPGHTGQHMLHARSHPSTGDVGGQTLSRINWRTHVGHTLTIRLSRGTIRICAWHKDRQPDWEWRSVGGFMEEEVTELKMVHRGGRCVQRLRRVELPRTFGEVGGGMRGQWQEEDGFSREQMDQVCNTTSPRWIPLHPTRRLC